MGEGEGFRLNVGITISSEHMFKTRALLSNVLNYPEPL